MREKGGGRREGNEQERGMRSRDKEGGRKERGGRRDDGEGMRSKMDLNINFILSDMTQKSVC